MVSALMSQPKYYQQQNNKTFRVTNAAFRPPRCVQGSKRCLLNFPPLKPGAAHATVYAFLLEAAAVHSTGVAMRLRAAITEVLVRLKYITRKPKVLACNVISIWTCLGCVTKAV
jgi:hypothetical protein